MRSSLIVIYAMILFLGSMSAFGQTSKVRLERFEIDGKEQSCDYHLEIHFSGKSHRAIFTENSFLIPVGLDRAKRIDINFRCGETELSFIKLIPADFKYRGARYVWRIGVDHFPFESSQVDSSIARNVKEAHYIVFEPDGYVATRLQVLIPKPSKSRSKED